MNNLPHLPTCLRRVKKKSDIELNRTEHGGSSAESGGEEGSSLPPDSVLSPQSSALSDSPEPEESIYDTMKTHMRAQKDALDRRNAQGLPASRMNRFPAAAPVAAPPPAAPVEKFTDLSNLAGLWAAMRGYLADNGRYLESVLGPTGQVTAIRPEEREVTLTLPATQRNFANDKAQAKLEEALRKVTGLPLKLMVEFVDQPAAAQGAGMAGDASGGHGGAAASAMAQRIPPELLNAVKNQPLMQELAKRLDGAITHIEILAAQAVEGE